MNIFVSYTTRDVFIEKNLLREVAKALSEFGTPYIDLIHNTATNKQEHVELQLINADFLLLLSSSSIPQSSWVMWEIEKANKIGLPILSVPADEKDIPTLLGNLKTRLAKTLTPKNQMIKTQNNNNNNNNNSN